MDLEPCPICRSVKTKLQQGNDWAFVECRECGTAGPTREDPEEAEVSWNTRAQDPEHATLRARLAKARELNEVLAAAVEWHEHQRVHGVLNMSDGDLEQLYQAHVAAVEVLAKIKGGE